MATKVVSVTLRALVDDYKRSMQSAGKATEDVARKADGWRNLGRSAANLGDSLSTRLTLPILAVGGAAVKMASDFDASFVQMTTLAGASTSEVDALKESVLGLAGEVGKSPAELAEALFFLQSSGLDSAAAMDALTASAKASAVGMGSTVQIADAVSSAMNAYARSGLSAAEATDVLVATARAGKAEPAELAAQMGRVLPVAAELGVSFNDVGAAIASLSLGGNDAAASTTQLQNILMKLVRPSQQGAEALGRVGLSVEDLEGMISSQGLLGTLETLRARLGDSGFRTFLEDSQAINAGLALTGENVEQVRGIFEDLGSATGATENAFSTWAESMGAQNAQAFAKLQVAMIKFGEQLAPIAADVATFAGGLIEAFASLPEGVRELVLAFAGLLAVIGPILSVGGRLVQFGSTLDGLFRGGATGVDGYGRSVGRLPRVVRGAAMALGALGAAFTVLQLLVSNNQRQAEDWVSSIGSDIDTSNLDGVRDRLRELRDELDELDNREGKGRVVSVGGVNIFSTSGDAERQDRIDQLRESIGQLEAEEESLAAQERETAGAIAGTSDATADMSQAAADAILQVQELADALAATMDPLFGMADALSGNEDAQRAVVEAQQALNEAVAEFGPGSAEAAEAERQLAEAHTQAGRSALDVHAATAQLLAAIEANPAAIDSAKASLQSWVDQGLVSAETARVLAAEFDAAALQALALEGVDPTVQLDTEGYPETSVRLAALKSQANAIPSERTVDTAVDGYHESAVRLGALRSAADSIPRNITISVGLSGASEAVRQAQIIAGYRAAGGPTRANQAYVVGEHGPELFMSDSPGHIYDAATTAAMLSSPMMSSAGAYAMAGGGGVVNVAVSMAGAIIASQRDAERWVSQAWNGATRHGMVNIRPEAVRRR